MTDSLRWLRALHWPDEPGTVTYLELRMDWTECTLPPAPQAKFAGHTLPLQERAPVLCLALSTQQKLVKLGALHPATNMTRCGDVGR